MKEAACFQGQAVGLATASSLVSAGQRLTLTARLLDLSKLTGHPAVSRDARAEPATGARSQTEASAIVLRHNETPHFLSGLLAAPLALKARLARFFLRKPGELCGAALIHVLVPSPYQFSRNQSLRNRQSEILQLRSS